MSMHYEQPLDRNIVREENNVSQPKDKSIACHFTNCIRMLSAEAIEKAKSGHPGLPLGAADVAYVLWQKYLRFNPEKTDWINRDRFILSAGHGSMLLYSLLHLYGYDVSLDDIKNFRQLGARTPGHPEFGVTPGVEISTGPLGQGIANAVGMAIGYEMLRNRLTKNGQSPIDHRIWVLAGDGDIMEGVSAEAASLAGHLGLSNIIVIYDYNRNTIEGDTELAFSEDVAMRFKASGWDVLEMDGHDLADIDRVLGKVNAGTGKPTIIIAKTVIARGSINFEGSHKSHGAPLGDAEISLIKQKMGMGQEQCFCVADEVRAHARERVSELKVLYHRWEKEFEGFLAANPDMRQAYDEYQRTPAVDVQELLAIDFGKKDIATRVASGIVMQKLAGMFPYFAGGSADLGPSTNTLLKDASSFKKNDRLGRNLHFGIREHAMGSILNGMAAYGNFIPYGSTFLVFSDYMKPPVRMAALMKLHVVYVFTHDSFYVGEDGPTHQPVEHVWSLRAIPGLDVIRPADPAETSAAWAMAVNNNDRPTALILTRQNVPSIDRTKRAPAEHALRGGYVISAEAVPEKIDLLLISSGSEVHLVLGVQELLQKEGLSVRVVSMPSIEIFERQDKAYRDSVLPPAVRKRVAVEAGISGGWHKFLGLDGLFIGLEEFGVSGPGNMLAEKYGFTVDKVHARVKRWLA